MKNQLIIPSIIIAAAIFGGFWMLKSPSEPQKVIVVQPPDISIHKAAEDGNIEAVKKHLAAGTDVNAKNEDDDGVTPLYYAAANGHKEIVELLIAKGADVNAKTERGSIPMHYAVFDGHKEIVELLIAEGADVNALNSMGVTPLDWAINLKHTETADLIRKHGGKTAEEFKAEGK